MTDDNLTASYRRLLLAYPKRYRRERGRELVDLYREVSGDRRRPRPADAADLILGGVRERLRAAGLAGIADALPTAAVFVLTALSALSVYYLVTFELHPDSTESGDSFGPFATFFVCAYAGWLVTAVTAAVLPGRAARISAAVSLALVLVGVALRLGRAPVPDLKSFVMFALVVLGLAALALPTAPSWPARLAPIAAAAVTGVAAAARVPIGGTDLHFGGTSFWDPGVGTYATCCNYRLPAAYALHLTAFGLLAAGVVLALAHAAQGRTRGAWTLLILTTPAAASAAVRLAELEPVRTVAYRVSGMNEIAVCVAGLLVMLLTAGVIPLLTGRLVLITRGRAARIGQASEDAG